jgi:cysteine-rich repeat protein
VRTFVLASVGLLGCYAPAPAIGVPCAANLACPHGQACDTSRSPPVCVPTLVTADAVSPGDGAGACGDGAIVGTEACDDGALVDGDGCSSTCAVELGFACDGAPSSCAALGPFGASALLAMSDPIAFDDDPSLTDDLLEIYFSSDRSGGPGGEDVWFATRAATSDPWGAAAPVPGVNSASNENTPMISADGLTLWFASQRGGGAHDLYVATRASRTLPWEPPVVIGELGSSQSDFSPSPDPDALVMYLATNRTGGSGLLDIWRSSRMSVAEPWGAPAPVGELDTAADEFNAFVRGGRFMFFTSDRGGNRDLWTSTRARADEPFATPAPMTELNTASDDQDPWVSADLRRIVYTCGSDLCEASR